MHRTIAEVIVDGEFPLIFGGSLDRLLRLPKLSFQFALASSMQIHKNIDLCSVKRATLSYLAFFHP